MKVLLLCMAFAAVSLAMPVAEEVALLVESAPAADPKAEEQPQVNAQPAPAVTDEVKLDAAPEIKEEKAPEPEPKSVVLDKKPVVPVEEAAKSEPEKTPEPAIANPAEDVKVEKLEPKPDTEVKQDETKAVVQEIRNNAAAKSALTDDAIDVMSVKADANIAEDPASSIPMPEKKIDLPVEPSKDKPTEIVDAAAEKPENPEEKKEAKTEEKASEPAPVGSEEPKTPETKEEGLRAVRDTAEEPKVLFVEPVKLDEVKEEKVVEEVKNDETPKELQQAEPTKASETAADAQPTTGTQPKVDTKDAVAPVAIKKTEEENLPADQPKNSSEESKESIESNESEEKISPKDKVKIDNKDNSASSEESTPENKS